MNVSKQQGRNDCGLFAIAFAERLLAGEDPCSVTFNQREMRSHLMECLEAGRIRSFPETGFRVCRRPVALEYTAELFCICRQIYVKNDNMIQCKACHEWIHPECIGMDKQKFDTYISEKGISFICSSCSEKAWVFALTIIA